MQLRTLAAATVTFAMAGSAAHSQEGDGLDTIRREFLGIMQENGWKDARIGQLSGSEGLFEIRDFKASREGSDGRPESVEIAVLTVEGLKPEDRWTRAASLRADDVKVVVSGNAIDIGAIYAKNPGILDIDLGRPAAAFETAVVARAAWSRDGKALAKIDEMYASADRWIGRYGIPGRLDLTAKGSVSPLLPLLAAIGGGQAQDPISGEFGLKSSVSSSRDELSVTASFGSGHASWLVAAILTDFDTALFRTWFDRDNPEEDRSPEVARSYVEAFDREVAQISLKSFEVRGKSDGSPTHPVISALGSAVGVWLPGLAGTAAAPALTEAFRAFSQYPKSFYLSAYARDAVPVTGIVAGEGEPLSGFHYKTSR